MNHEEKIKELEAREAALTVQTIEGARAGAVSPSLRRELEDVRAELKVARRVRAMDAKRVDPKLTRKVSFLMPENEYEALLQKAEGNDLSKYIRDLIKKGA
jgi:hypothetical protein